MFKLRIQGAKQTKNQSGSLPKLSSPVQPSVTRGGEGVLLFKGSGLDFDGVVVLALGVDDGAVGVGRDLPETLALGDALDEDRETLDGETLGTLPGALVSGASGALARGCVWEPL